MRRFFLSLFLAEVLISQVISWGFYKAIASTLYDLGLKKYFIFLRFLRIGIFFY